MSFTGKNVLEQSLRKHSTLLLDVTFSKLSTAIFCTSVNIYFDKKTSPLIHLVQDKQEHSETSDLQQDVIITKWDYSNIFFCIQTMIQITVKI